MSDDHSIVIPGGNPTAKGLAPCRGEILLSGHQNIGGGIELKVFTGPLPNQVIGHHHHGFVAQAQPLALLGNGNQLEGLAGPYAVSQQSVPSIERPRNGILLMGTQRNFRIHPRKEQVRAVIFSGAQIVEPLVVERCQPFPAVRGFPNPVLKRLLDLRLFPLGNGSFLFVEYRFSLTVHLHIVKDLDLPEIQTVLQNVIPADALGTIGGRCVNAAAVNRPAFNLPCTGVGGIVCFDPRPHVPRWLQQLPHKLLYI